MTGDDDPAGLSDDELRDDIEMTRDNIDTLRAQLDRLVEYRNDLVREARERGWSTWTVGVMADVDRSQVSRIHPTGRRSTR